MPTIPIDQLYEGGATHSRTQPTQQSQARNIPANYLRVNQQASSNEKNASSFASRIRHGSERDMIPNPNKEMMLQNIPFDQLENACNRYKFLLLFIKTFSLH